MITTDENDWYFAESQVSNDTYFVRLREALEHNPLQVGQLVSQSVSRSVCQSVSQSSQ